MTDSSARGATAVAPRRVESMSLLVDIAEQALDPGYAAAAARRRTAAGGGSRARPWLGLAGVLAATLVIVVAGVQAQRQAPAVAQARQRLVDQVQQMGNRVDALASRADALRTRTTDLRDHVLRSLAAGSARARQLATLEFAAGTVAASGPGLRVVLDDATGGRPNRVSDRDLQAVVNALWAAGAEAIAIDGQRLTPQSAIRQAGAAILVNFQPLARPYVVTALGDPVQLATDFGASRTSARMRALGQVFGLRFSYARVAAASVPAAPTLPLHSARAAADVGRSQ